MQDTGQSLQVMLRVNKGGLRQKLYKTLYPYHYYYCCYWFNICLQTTQTLQLAAFERLWCPTCLWQHFWYPTCLWWHFLVAHMPPEVFLCPHASGSIFGAPHSSNSVSNAPHASGSIFSVLHASGNISGGPHFSDNASPMSHMPPPACHFCSRLIKKYIETKPFFLFNYFFLLYLINF